MTDTIEAMTAKDAIDYCPLWGDGQTQDGADFYNLDDKGRPDDAETRDRMIATIDGELLPMAQAPDWDDKDDLEKLPALRAYLAGLTFPDPKPAHVFAEPAEIAGVSVAEVAKHYAIAMLWSSRDESTGFENLDEAWDVDDLAPETWATIESTVRAFLDTAGHLVTESNLIGRRSDSTVAAMAGHDLWLTQVGHGAGFWDGDWESDAHCSLDGPMTKAAKVGNEWADPYVGPDGLIYLG